MSNKVDKKQDDSISLVQQTSRVIVKIRGLEVIPDSDLARIFGTETKRLNEQVKRNENKFPSDFAFRLTKAETEDLKSRIATSSSQWGGRRTEPMVFTEHGALMAANVLNTELANKMSVYVIRAFMQLRELIPRENDTKALVPVEKSVEIIGSARIGTLQGEMSTFFDRISSRLEIAIEQVLDSVIDPASGTTVREEAQDLISKSIDHLKAKLAQTGLENQEIVATITKILAEAEKDRELARRTRAETEQLEFVTQIKKIRFILEARKALSLSDAEVLNPTIAKIDAFLQALKELS